MTRHAKGDGCPCKSGAARKKNRQQPRQIVVLNGRLVVKHDHFTSRCGEKSATSTRSIDKERVVELVWITMYRGFC